MPRLTREEEDALVERIEADAQDPDAWEDDPTPEPAERRTLGAQITVRLEPEVVDQLSAVARERRVGHTQLARQLIEEGLQTHAAGSPAGAEDATFTIEVRVRPSSGNVKARVA